MKKVYITFLLTIIAGVAHAIEICGPAVRGANYAYTYVRPLASGVQLGFWAVGPACDKSSATDIVGDDNVVVAEKVYAMCDGENATNIIVRGQALCTAKTLLWQSATEFDERSQTVGPNCWCRRTKMHDKTGKLVDSVGQWILVGNTQESTESCLNGCAQLCARNVAYDAVYNEGKVAAGNAIMVLSVF